MYVKLQFTILHIVLEVPRCYKFFERSYINKTVSNPFKTYITFGLTRPTIQQEVLGRTNHILTLIRHGLHWKRCVQQFYYCMCIRYHGNVFIEPLPRNDKGIFTELSGCLATIGE
jgi:hypothetical protein